MRRLTGSTRSIVGSGRTDRGVHATGQVASVTLPRRWTPPAFRKALNAVLPNDIWIREARQVPVSFHPRFDPVSRSYEYRLGRAEEASSPFHRRWCWPLEDDLDEALLDEGARTLLGDHSFVAFAHAGQPGRGTRCTIYGARWSPWGRLGLLFTITADRYLHRMVRYLVGTMVDIARGRRPPGDLPALLEARTTKLVTSPPAPPEGLFLSAVHYPETALRLETEVIHDKENTLRS